MFISVITILNYVTNYFQNHFCKDLHRKICIITNTNILFIRFPLLIKNLLKIIKYNCAMPTFIFRGHRSLSLPPSLSQKKVQAVTSASLVGCLVVRPWFLIVCTILTIPNFIRINEVCANFKRKERKKILLHVRQLRCSGFYYFVTVSESALSVCILWNNIRSRRENQISFFILKNKEVSLNYLALRKILMRL